MTGPGDLWQLPSLAVCHHFTGIIISFCDRVQYLKLIHLEAHSHGPSQTLSCDAPAEARGCDRVIILVWAQTCVMMLSVTQLQSYSDYTCDSAIPAQQGRHRHGTLQTGILHFTALEL